MPSLVRYEGAGRPYPSCAELRLRADRMLQALSVPQAELSILLCDDPLIRRLNRRHRGKNRPTDVLAFPSEAPAELPGSPKLLGDVVISLPTARRQAATAGHPIVREVTVLLAHGLLHLLGFDHVTEAEDRRMRAKTDVLVAAGCG